MTYKDAMHELQELLQELEQAPADIDSLGERVKRAKTLIEFCRNRLRDVEAEIDELDAEKEA
ncbi:MAG: exodeoxyribonuclease VII small subunit [Bacteroidota bacterium]